MNSTDPPALCQKRMRYIAHPLRFTITITKTNSLHGDSINSAKRSKPMKTRRSKLMKLNSALARQPSNRRH